jgi:hypothetical protein
VTDGRIPLESLDSGIVHAAEVVVGFIVLADVIEAEPEILAFLRAPFRGAVRAALRTARHVTGAPDRLWLRPNAGFAPIDPDLVEIGRVELHLVTMPFTDAPLKARHRVGKGLRHRVGQSPD